MRTKKSDCVMVPKWWLTGLLERADEFSAKIISMEYQNEYQWSTDRDELFRKASALLGYAVDGERFVEDHDEKNRIQTESTIFNTQVYQAD